MNGVPIIMVDLKRERDVVIVGAGPAGAGAAFWLARQGLDVLMIEAKSLPRSKPCGDGIGPRAVMALRAMGLEDWLNEAGNYRIERIRIVAPSGASVIAGAAPDLFPVDYGCVIRRDDFDHKLVHHAVDAGAGLIEGCRADGFLDGNGNDCGLPTSRITGVTGLANGQRCRIKAKLTVVADGSNGRLSHLCNRQIRGGGMALRTYAEGVYGVDDCVNLYFTSRFPHGYGWVFPTGPETANIGVGLLRRTRKAGQDSLRSAFTYFTTEQNLAPLSLRGCEFAGRPVGSIMRMDFRQCLIQRPGLAHVGDAVGLVSPLNGEGISHALESAQLLADAVENKFVDTRRLDYALVAYERALRRRFSTYFVWGHLFSRLLSRPQRLDRLVLQAKKHDYLRLALAGILTNTAHPRELGRLRIVAKLLW